MERLTIPDVRVDEHTTRRSVIDVLAVQEHAMEIYHQLKIYEDIAELCGGVARLRELAEADKDGRVIILPCKVYETDGVRVYEHTVREVIYETAGGPAFDKNAIGKSIFLTRAEAERAIQEMEGKKNGNETSM